MSDQPKQPSVSGASITASSHKERSEDEEDDHAEDKLDKVLSWTTTNDIEAALQHGSIQTSTSWYGSPYLIEAFAQHFQDDVEYRDKNHYATVIEAFQKLGVQVYVIDATNVNNQAELLQPILEVMDLASQENYVPIDTTDPVIGWQRCLLYKDEENRLFNLILPKDLTGLERTLREQSKRFSVIRALVAFVILLRQIPCVCNSDDVIKSLRPFFLCLTLGIVFTSEISLSSLNSSMMVRGTPSISAHTVKYSSLLTGSNTGDGLRKTVLLCFAVASITTGGLQRFFAMFGIVLACVVLLANLGARSWQCLGIEPIQYRGRGSFIFAYCWAVLAGIAMPVMGHRAVMAGGTTAMEHVLKSSLTIAAFIVITAYEGFQKLLVDGSIECNQQVLHLNLGFWWMSTVIGSLVKVKSLQCRDDIPNGEKLLVEDPASPVGRRVSLLPDYIFDIESIPHHHKYLGVAIEFAVYILVAVALGYFYASLATS